MAFLGTRKYYHLGFISADTSVTVINWSYFLVFDEFGLDGREGVVSLIEFYRFKLQTSPAYKLKQHHITTSLPKPLPDSADIVTANCLLTVNLIVIAFGVANIRQVDLLSVGVCIG
jgi:hypothetical protein